MEGRRGGEEGRGGGEEERRGWRRGVVKRGGECNMQEKARSSLH